MKLVCNPFHFRPKLEKPNALQISVKAVTKEEVPHTDNQENQSEVDLVMTGYTWPVTFKNVFLKNHKLYQMGLPIESKCTSLNG